MVGFMRRYDDGYRAMKDAVTGGDIGAPLLFHSAHRNPAVPSSVTTEGVVVDTCVHDIDVAGWLALDAMRHSRHALSANMSGHTLDVGSMADPATFHTNTVVGCAPAARRSPTVRRSAQPAPLSPRECTPWRALPR